MCPALFPRPVQLSTRTLPAGRLPVQARGQDQTPAYPAPAPAAGPAQQGHRHLRESGGGLKWDHLSPPCVTSSARSPDTVSLWFSSVTPPCFQSQIMSCSTISTHSPSRYYYYYYFIFLSVLFLLKAGGRVQSKTVYVPVLQDGVMVLSATHRYKKKYVTTLLYKPI